MNRLVLIAGLLALGPIIGCGSESSEDTPTTMTPGGESGSDAGDETSGGEETGDSGDTSADSSGDDGSSSADDSTGDGSDGGDFPPYEGLFDCGPDFPVSEDPRCGNAGPKGQVGSGPIFLNDGATGAGMGGGSIDPDTAELFLMVSGLTDDTGLLGEQDDSSALFAVDLETGDRRIVSGLSIDVANGNAMIGEGPLFDETASVQVADDGMLYVNGRAGLMAVDRTTGARTLVRSWNLDDTGADICLYVSQLGGGGNFIVAPGAQQFYFAWASFAGPLGTSRGVMLYDRGTDQCTVFSSSGDTVQAMGPAFTDVPSGLVLVGDKMFASTFMGAALFEVDVATGQRRIITKSGAPEVGTGPCLFSDYVAVGTDVTYVTGGDTCQTAGPTLTMVDLATGERTSGVDNHGPAGRVLAAWAHPFWPVLIAVDPDADSLVLWDRETGNSVYLSR